MTKGEEWFTIWAVVMGLGIIGWFTAIFGGVAKKNEKVEWVMGGLCLIWTILMITAWIVEVRFK